MRSRSMHDLSDEELPHSGRQLERASNDVKRHVLLIADSDHAPGRTHVVVAFSISERAAYGGAFRLQLRHVIAVC